MLLEGERGQGHGPQAPALQLSPLLLLEETIHPGGLLMKGGDGGGVEGGGDKGCKGCFQNKVFLQIRISKCLVFVLWSQCGRRFRMATALLERDKVEH